MEYDVIVVGGSFAGLSAAMMLARARRKIAVLDGGRPRNRFSPRSHGFFGFDGVAPGELIAQARAKVAQYPTVTFIEDLALEAAGSNDAFELKLSTRTLRARRLVLAHGVRDILPDVAGLQERWGQTVLHCPYCHGYEFAGKQLGVLATHPMAGHFGQLIPDWGPTTLFTNGQPAFDEETLAKLHKRGVTLVDGRVVEVLGHAPALTGVRLEDGRTVAIDALYVAPRVVLTTQLGPQLGCELEEGPFGPLLRTDEMKLTTVKGVYAAGDNARKAANATWASSDGVTAGAMCHQSLIFG